MKIAYDAKRAMRNMTGLGNYSRLVIESVAERYPECDLTLYSPVRGDSPRLDKIYSLPNVHLRTPMHTDRALSHSTWRTYTLSSILRREREALYHGLSNELPLSIAKAGIPTVLTMHDVIYRRLPHCYSPIDRMIYDYKYGHSCRAATRIIAISECTKRDIMELYQVPEHKIDVVYQGCDEIFHAKPDPAQTAAVLNKYSLPQQYVIQVGSIEARKNAALTLRGMHALPSEIPLVLVGRRTKYADTLLKIAEREGLAHRLIMLHDVPFTDLPHLYRGALIAAYPSYYEGFGIPIIEALYCGTPVVAATGSCLEEAGGDGALYVDTDSPQQMAEAMLALYRDPQLRDRMKTLGHRHATRFQNCDIAERIMAVYQRAITDFLCR